MRENKIVSLDEYRDYRRRQENKDDKQNTLSTEAKSAIELCQVLLGLLGKKRGV